MMATAEERKVAPRVPAPDDVQEVQVRQQGPCREKHTSETAHHRSNTRSPAAHHPAVGDPARTTGWFVECSAANSAAAAWPSPEPRPTCCVPASPYRGLQIVAPATAANPVHQPTPATAATAIKHTKRDARTSATRRRHCSADRPHPVPPHFSRAARGRSGSLPTSASRPARVARPPHSAAWTRRAVTRGPRQRATETGPPRAGIGGDLALHVLPLQCPRGRARVPRPSTRADRLEEDPRICVARCARACAEVNGHDPPAPGAASPQRIKMQRMRCMPQRRSPATLSSPPSPPHLPRNVP